MSKSFDVDSFLQDLDSGKLGSQQSHSNSASKSQSFHTHPQPASYEPSRHRSPAIMSHETDVDAFLASLDQPLPISTRSQVHTRQLQQPSLSTGQTRFVKCLKVMVGGEKTQKGVNRLISGQLACNNLHCTNCDFHVIMLPNVAWLPSAQYIDFRNANTKIESLYQLTMHRPGLFLLLLTVNCFLSRNNSVLLPMYLEIRPRPCSANRSTLYIPGY